MAVEPKPWISGFSWFDLDDKGHSSFIAAEANPSNPAGWTAPLRTRHAPRRRVAPIKGDAERRTRPGHRHQTQYIPASPGAQVTPDVLACHRMTGPWHGLFVAAQNGSSPAAEPPGAAGTEAGAPPAPSPARKAIA